MLKIHILNVGHGDCIIVDFPSGRLSVIDVNNATQIEEASFDEIISESLGVNALTEKILYKAGLETYAQLLEKAGYNIELTDPLAYINKIRSGRNIFRFISSHPHMDHLSGLKTLHEKIGILNFWILKTDFKPDIDNLDDMAKQDWEFYDNLRNGTSKEGKVIWPHEGAEGDFWQHDNVSILAPNPKILADASKENHTSYVLFIKYGPHKIVLGGDAEENTWKYLVEKYPEHLKNVTILKASHHGRDTGYYQEAVKLMSPDTTVVSVGKKPETDASQKYSQYSKRVLSTRWHGNVWFDLNEDGTGTYYTEHVRN